MNLMAYEFATMVITLPVAVNLRKLAQMLDRGETDGMFETRLSATGNLPATHFISSGQMPEIFIAGMKNPTALRNRAMAAYAAEGVTFTFTLLQVTNALAQCTISDGTFNSLPESPFAMVERLGLKFIGPAL